MSRSASRQAAAASVEITRSGVALPEWRFHIVAEIANFDALRRLIGRERAATLAATVAERLSDLPGDGRVSVDGGRRVDLAFEGRQASDLTHRIAILRQFCALPFDLDGELFPVDLFFGGSSAAMRDADEISLIEDAERALAEARAARDIVTHELLPPSTADAARLVTELADAIEHDQLALQYQPKLNVRMQSITSVEGLIRWNHPERGVILPGDFIPIAEQSDLIVPMTLWTIRQAIVDQEILAARGHDLRVFINISGQLLSNADFVRDACALIGDSDTKLGFEITETSVIHDPQSAIKNIQLFADFGIVIAIDDYGAGLSSLAYLKQLPARELKIDKLFVTQLTSSHRDPLIVRSTIDLAHALEMEVVAEGVETHPTMALLTVMGCDMIQGFLISRPIGLEALCIFLDQDRTPLLQNNLKLFGSPATRMAG